MSIEDDIKLIESAIDMAKFRGDFPFGTSNLKRALESVKTYVDTVQRWFAICRSCGGQVTVDRFCYAIPTCHTCLPPPPPLEIAEGWPND